MMEQIESQLEPISEPVSTLLSSLPTTTSLEVIASFASPTLIAEPTSFEMVTISDFGFNLRGIVLLVNLDEFGSLDHTCIHKYYHKQAPQSVKKKRKKFNHAYSKGDLDLNNS